VRGLAHPVVVGGAGGAGAANEAAAGPGPAFGFAGSAAGSAGGPGAGLPSPVGQLAAGRANPFAAFLSTYGAVPVSGNNMYQLLKNGEAVLLYPGGAREVGPLPHPPPAQPAGQALTRHPAPRAGFQAPR